MDKNTFLNSGLLEQYVMGLTTPEESAEVEKMAATYPEIERKLCEMQNCMEQYVKLHEIEPPEGAKEEILSSINNRTKKQSNSSQQYTYDKVIQLNQWAAGLAALLVLGLFGVSFVLYQNQKSAQEQIAELSGELQDLRYSYNELKADNTQVMQQYAVLKDLATKHVRMQGTNHAPQAKLVVYWNENHNKALLNIVNMPEAPSGHTYQVWADVNGQHKNMGLLKQVNNKKQLYSLPFISNCKGIVITLEKEGGSPHPSVDKMYAHGEMSL